MRTPTLKALVESIRDSDLDAARAILEGAPDLVSAHDPNSFGATPLLHAVHVDDRSMVDLLLAAGADIDQRSDWWAGSFGVLDSASDDLAEYLLERGATLTAHAAARLGMKDALLALLDDDPSLAHARGGDGQLPLHFSRTPAIAELLLERGAAIDARDFDHESTAAQWRATDRPEVAAYLVSRGCAVDPFLAALVEEFPLLERTTAAEPDGVNVRVTPERFPTTGARAALHIYAYTIGTGAALLHACGAANRAASVRWLTKHGAQVDARGGYDEQTPLHAAAWHDAVDAANALLDAGAPIDAKSGSIHHNEPLGWAIVSGAARMVDILIERGATVRDEHRESAAAGAAGRFLQYNRTRPRDRWVEIARRLDAVG